MLGKSSLINSLLGHHGLAYTVGFWLLGCDTVLIIAKNGNGNAVTSVVTEFRHKADGDNQNFKIEVVYFDSCEKRLALEEYVWSFQGPMRMDLETRQGQEEKDEYEKAQREHEIAKCALKAAFGHRGEALWKLLSHQHTGSLDNITDQLNRWTNDLELPVDGKYDIYLHSPKQCRTKLRDCMVDRLWPFTKMIRCITYSATASSLS